MSLLYQKLDTHLLSLIPHIGHHVQSKPSWWILILSSSLTYNLYGFRSLYFCSCCVMYMLSIDLEK